MSRVVGLGQGHHPHDRHRPATRCALCGPGHLRRSDHARPLRGWRGHRRAAAGRAPEGRVMLSWGLIVFVGLWLLLADVAPVRRAQLMGHPWLIHFVVIGSGLWIHGGSADGAMAAIVSGICSALYVRYQQRCHGVHPQQPMASRRVPHPGSPTGSPLMSTVAVVPHTTSTPRSLAASSRPSNVAPPRGCGRGRRTSTRCQSTPPAGARTGASTRCCWRCKRPATAIRSTGG